MIPLSDDQPTRTFPGCTIAIIALNVFVFAGWQLQIGLPHSVMVAGLIPAELTHGGAAENGIRDLFMSMFMHGGWMHLIGNMWFLWIFGNNVEDATGHIRYVVFYLICGVFAALAYVVCSPN